ncbi:MAG: nucleotidyltransferase family protein [Robiginitomaculum sp.]|nr:nucleotidyltransferase family protein [Robiginitomaculum sp.]
MIKVTPIKNSPITTAMVMAAGHGTRLRPLTDATCKAMVKVGGKMLVDHTLDRLQQVGVKRAVVNVHTFADDLETHLRKRTIGPEIIISNEREELLETGGGVVKALPLLGDAPVFICNIDAMWIGFEDVLGGMIRKWNPDTMDELFLLAPRSATLGLDGRGDFKLAKDGRISRAGADGSDWFYSGVEIFKPQLAKPFKVEKFSRNKVWDNTLKRRKAYGHILSGFWMHVGDPKAHQAAEAVLVQKDKMEQS